MTVLPDTDDEKWEYAAHTRKKHDLLRYYLVQWVKKLSGGNRKLRLFDCFAGRGKYVDEGNGEPIPLENIEAEISIPGSPLIILDVAAGLSHLTDEIECVFMEPRAKNRSILQESLNTISGIPENVSIRLDDGEFQDGTIDLVENTGGWNSNIPTFFFIDPFGYEDLDYNVVTKLGSQRRFEVFVNLMAEQLVRWKSDPSKHDAFETLFGTSDWKEDIENFESEYWDDDEVEYYCHRLEEAGITHTIACLITRKETRAMVYYLVHGSTHADALEHMRNAIDECGTGRFAYAPQRPELHEQQAGLSKFSETPPQERFTQYLLAQFGGETISFDDIVKHVIEDDEYVSFRRGEIKKILKELRDENVIETSPVTSKTERGLQGSDIVQFPD